jgi:hypothetical protein
MEQDSDILEYLLVADDQKILKRVKDAIDRPESCDCCGSAVRLVNNREVYGKSFGDWPLMYLCSNKQCSATVGCHPRTTIPLGRMATKETRAMRKKVHDLIDPMWRGIKRPGLRSSVYRRLADCMGIPMHQCHVGMFTIEQCEEAMRAIDGWRDKKQTSKP